MACKDRNHNRVHVLHVAIPLIWSNKECHSCHKQVIHALSFIFSRLDFLSLFIYIPNIDSPTWCMSDIRNDEGKKPSLAWLIGISQLLITVAYFVPTLLGIVQSNDRHDYEFLGRRPFLLHNLRVSPHRIKVTWSSYKGLMVSK